MDTAASCFFSTRPFSPSSSPSSSSSSSSSASAFLSPPPLTPVAPARVYGLRWNFPCQSHSHSRALALNPISKPISPLEGLKSFDEVFASFVQRKKQRVSAAVATEKAREEASTDKNGWKSKSGGGGGGKGVGVKKDYYSILGLKKNASLKEIRMAYRSLALQFHPDVSPIIQLDIATQTFSQINEAYAVLSDPQRRTRYDLKLGLESPSAPMENQRNNYAQSCVKPYTDTSTGRVYPSINSFYREWQGSKH